jgi:hypothetical protein
MDAAALAIELESMISALDYTASQRTLREGRKSVGATIRNGADRSCAVAKHDHGSIQNCPRQ